MDEKNIEVVIEAFGNRSLKKTFTPEEMRGKNFAQIVYAMMEQPWQGEDKLALNMIRPQVNASGGFTPKVYNPASNQPIKFVPVGQQSQVIDYVQSHPLEDNQLRINVTPKHVVGTYLRD